MTWRQPGRNAAAAKAKKAHALGFGLDKTATARNKRNWVKAINYKQNWVSNCLGSR
jgi:hypothetical protein